MDTVPVFRGLYVSPEARDEEMAAQFKAAGVPNEPPLRINIGDLIEEAGRFC